ncbi:Matrilin-4 [Tritrichomonas musculus]|uniref:Matrilin-4 n=1 Tax=Tritrichomonas musculus TaxID=1915356 RepID=A0ABR2KX07_9EUKA
MVFIFSILLFIQSINDKEHENEFNNKQNFDNNNPNDQYNQVDDIENQKEFIRNKRRRRRGNRNQFDGAPDNENLNQKCEMPHTRRNFAGQCVCEKGYQTTDASGLGCWKCTERCHLNAQCEKGGICKCINGYKGDGVKSCDIIPPTIKSIDPTEINYKDLNQGFRVNVSYSYLNYVSNEAFCAFGAHLIKTPISGSEMISCPIPPGVKGKSLLRISFNNRDWSQEEVYFTIKGESFDFEIAGVYFLIFAILFAIARAAYVQYKEWKRPGKMSNKSLTLARRRRRGLT